MKNNILKEKDNRRLFICMLIKKLKDDEVNYLSAQVAYHLIVATIPFLLVVIHLMLFVAQDQLGMILEYLDFLPEEIFSLVKPIIITIVDNRSTSILSAGIIVALWSSSNGMKSIIRAFNKAFDNTSKGGFIHSKIKGIIFTLLLMIIIFSVLGFLVFGNIIVESLQRILNITFDKYIIGLLKLFQNLLTPIGMTVAFSIFYKFGPDFNKGKSISYKMALVGGAIATIGWLVITNGYAFYISNISNMSITYGPLVGIMVLFIWFNLSSMMILIGAEIISVYDTLNNKLKN